MTSLTTDPPRSILIGKQKSMAKLSPTVQMSQTLSIRSFPSPRTSPTKLRRMTAIALHSLHL
ncbi:hypothetical protein LB505_013677 [Fusarium chuoi]|nr:hypothetical protein LB505_013677 [Fusarium chuoi]